MKFLQSPEMSVCDTEGFGRITLLVEQGWNVLLEELCPGGFMGSKLPSSASAPPNEVPPCREHPLKLLLQDPSSDSLESGRWKCP